MDDIYDVCRKGEVALAFMNLIGIRGDYHDNHHAAEWSYVVSAIDLYDIFTDEQKFAELTAKIKMRHFQ